MSNIGIIAGDFAIPRYFVDQRDVEAELGRPGYCTAGLGQSEIAVACPGVDAVTLALESVHRLVYRVLSSGMPADELFGRLSFVGVGTESQPDRAKAVKTHVVGLLRELATGVGARFSGFVEGVDHVNACYGGTAAVLAAADHCAALAGRSPAPLALVVAADVAEYNTRGAAPTSGAGAAAFLVGPDAPLVLARGDAVTWCDDRWDFYKPVAEYYPRLDGNGDDSVGCYLRAVAECAQAARERAGGNPFADADALICHAPFRKLTVRAHACALEVANGRPAPADRAALKEAEAAHAAKYATHCGRDGRLSCRTGNSYTASVWFGLLSHVAGGGAEADAGRVWLFSYGSGLMASLLPFERRATALLMPTGAEVDARLSERASAPPAVIFKDSTAAPLTPLPGWYVRVDGDAGVRTYSASAADGPTGSVETA